MTIGKLSAVLVGVSAVAMASHAQASGPVARSPAAAPHDYVVYSNLGPKGDRYSDIEVWAETGQDVEGGFTSTAFAFKPTSPFLLTRLKLALTYFPSMGKAHTFELVLARDNNGVPGTHLVHQRIETDWTGGCCKLLSVDLKKTVRVAYGQTYWVITLANPQTYGGWFDNYDQLSGLAAVSYDGGRSWQSQPNSRNIAAFAVYGAPASQ